MSPLDLIFPANNQWDPAVDDVSKVPIDAHSVRLVSGATAIDKLPAYAGLRALWCFDIDAKAVAAICNCSALESLYIENLKTGDLSSLKRLTQLNVLSLERCSRVTSLEDLGRLNSLRGLGITHFKNVNDLRPLARLRTLRALAVAGSVWATMRVASFEPLGHLAALEFLHLTNIKAEDGSLKPLSRLVNLRKIDLANFYSVTEFAWLAQKLPSTECQWFRAYVEMAHVPCSKCGVESLVMLTGKGRTTVCKRCDRVKFQKHLDEWTRASDAAGS